MGIVLLATSYCSVVYLQGKLLSSRLAKIADFFGASVTLRAKCFYMRNYDVATITFTHVTSQSSTPEAFEEMHDGTL